MELVVRCAACSKAHTFSDLVPFRAECEACAADLHVCLTCRFYDRYVENECREDQSDPVARKDRRNLCEYFKPILPGDTDATDAAAAAAKARLRAAFGEKPTPTAPAGPSAAAPSAADEARARLEALFKKKD
jgi:phytoene dehydrogenase-like protein